MNLSSIRRHLRSAFCACLCALSFCGLWNRGELRAAKSPDDLPRYRLKPGQELKYHGEAEFKYGKNVNALPRGSATDWRVWVARANANGSWRIIVSVSSRELPAAGKDSAQSEQPIERQMAWFDLFPDGHTLPVQASENIRVEPGKLFPRLPPDALAIKKGWADDREDGFLHCDYTADPQHTSGTGWAFDEDLQRAWDEIYDATTRTKFFFDRERGLIQRAESELTWGNGFDEKGKDTIEFVAIQDHDESWTKSFAEEADRYFAAADAYHKQLIAAGHDADHAPEMLTKAETELKGARANLTLTDFTEPLDKQLSEHKRQADCIAKEVMELAERKDKPAAEWSLDDLNGKTHALADYRGKVVVLDFWYRGCGWCIRAMPQVRQVAKDFKDSPVAVLGMNTDRDEKDAQFVVEAMQLSYPILKATDVPAKYGVHGFPTLIIIDQQGTVRDIHVGYSKTLRAEVSKIIKELLAGSGALSAVVGQAAEAPAPKTDPAPKPKDERPRSTQRPANARPIRFIPARQPTQTTTKGTMRIHVVDADGQPVAAAKIHEGVWTNEKDFKHNRDYECDANGWAEIELPKTLWILRLWSRKDGYVPLFAHWEERMPADQRVIPDEFTFPMKKGMVIGGVVKDEDGKPVSGAKVEVRYVDNPHDQMNRLSNDIWLAYGDDAATTNAEGRWSLNDIPPGDETRVQVKLRHPDYVSDFDWGSPVRATTTHFAMVRGTRVTGTITDADGKPVSGALVIWGNDPYLQNLPQQEVHSDEKGGYRLPPLPDGRMTVTVVAPGWMPELQHVEITQKMAPVDFQLKPGKTLRIKFVDQSSNPIPGVGVGIQGWRGEKSLYNHKHPNVVDSHIPRQADANGVYEWTWAPDDPVTYSFFKEDVGGVSNVSLTADGQDHVETLPP